MDAMNRLYERGRLLEKNKDINDRKVKGIFYTPMEVVDYMSKSLLCNVNLVENPYVKVLDISCGAGYFLLKVLGLLKAMFEQHLEEIIAGHPELRCILSGETINKFIVENNIWGVDIDAQAVEFVKATLQEAAGSRCHTNIICADSLLSGIDNNEFHWFWEQGFDIVIGNPPYIGHKAVPKDYKEELYKYYKDVYRDKADISYCFFKRGMDLLRQGGTLSFITSRYFIEGPSAAGLRTFLGSFAIEEILDFGDSKIFDDAGVAVCVISIRKSDKTDTIRVKKLRNRQDRELEDSLKKNVEEFSTDAELLQDEGWILLSPDKLKVFELIGEQSTHRLDEIFDSYQGIITGCDRAFILNREQAEMLNIEASLLRSWVKNSQVEKSYIKPSDKLIIYTDFIMQPENYPAALSFAEVYKNRLLQRRECKKGLREWYKLQWGRNSKSFEEPKIIYPYKASANRFAVDRQGLYCSADVYSLLLKEELSGEYSLEYLAALMNSKPMEFYFKCFAKKISPSLFDYYPNTVLRIKLKLDILSKKIMDLADSLVDCQNAAERKCILQAIDREVYKMYGLREEHIQIIENSAGE